jgi:cytidylate kinase
LGLTYIDSGAMYRALAWAAQQRGLTREDEATVITLLGTTHIQLIPQADGSNQVLVDGQDITAAIRTPEVSQLASQLSALSPVRRRMVALQQDMARAGGVVMEGRDIQTVVLPDAEVKIFLTAPAEERAHRRWLELQQRGLASSLEEVLADLKIRDERDTTRADSPLKAAPDAVHIDTGGLTIEQVVERVLSAVAERCPSA